MRSGTEPGIDSRSAARRPCGRQRPRAIGVGMTAGLQHGRPSPFSTTTPAYITAMRSQTCAATPRLCVTSRIDSPRRCAQVEQQAEDLCLDGHIEGRRRLVGDEQLGAARQRHGDADPLPHPAAQPVRVGVQHAAVVGETDRAQGLPRRIGRLPAVHFAVEARITSVQLVADGEHRVQRGERVLEDHRHARAPQTPAAGPHAWCSRSRPANRSRRLPRRSVAGQKAEHRAVRSRSSRSRTRRRGPALRPSRPTGTPRRAPSRVRAYCGTRP